MAFRTELAFEDELDLELALLELQDESDIGLQEDLKGTSLIETKTYPKGIRIRISGFDWRKVGPPPDPDVVNLHKAAVARIIREIKSRTTLGNCITVWVAGYADPNESSVDTNKLSEARAKSILNQFWNGTVLPDANKGRTTLNPALGMGVSPIWTPSNTHRKRALNRRVEVQIQQKDTCF